MKRGTPTHPKTLDLKDRLSTSLPVAVGVLEMLWHMTAQYAPAGDIGRFSNSAIARAVGWDEPMDADALIKRLVEARFLDESKEHRLIVHDWPDHAEDSIHMKLGRARQLFADGTPPNLKRIPTQERTELAKFYKQRTESHRIAQNRTDAHDTAQNHTALALAVALALAKPLPSQLPQPAETAPPCEDVPEDSQPIGEKPCNQSGESDCTMDFTLDLDSKISSGVALQSTTGTGTSHGGSSKNSTTSPTVSKPYEHYTNEQFAGLVYAEYPRKIGRPDSIRHLVKRIKPLRDAEAKWTAIQAMIAHVQLYAKSDPYPVFMHASTFFCSHMDDDPDAWKRKPVREASGRHTAAATQSDGARRQLEKDFASSAAHAEAVRQSMELEANADNIDDDPGWGDNDPDQPGEDPQPAEETAFYGDRGR